jgi:hypothetical protein
LKAKNHFYGKLLLILFLLAANTTVFADDCDRYVIPSPGEDTSTAASMYKHTESKLECELGAIPAKAYSDMLAKKYPGYRAVSVCSGTFNKLGDNDIALALFNQKKESALYVVGMGKKNLDIHEITHFSASINQYGYITEELITSCESKTSYERIVNNEFVGYLGSRAASGHRELINNMDTVCIGLQGDSTAFYCYQYDPGKKAFVETGGWSTD